MTVENHINKNRQKLVNNGNVVTDKDNISVFSISNPTIPDTIHNDVINIESSVVNTTEDPTMQLFYDNLSYLLRLHNILGKLQYSRKRKTDNLTEQYAKLHNLHVQRSQLKHQLDKINEFNRLIDEQRNIIYNAERFHENEINLLENDLYILKEYSKYADYARKYLPHFNIEQSTDAELFYNCIYHYYHNHDNNFTEGNLTKFPSNPTTWSDQNYENNFDNLIWFCREFDYEFLI